MSPKICYAQVVVPPLAGELTYRIERELEGRLSLGSKVEVPLGSRTAHGYVTAFCSEAERLQNSSSSPEATQLSLDKKQTSFAIKPLLGLATPLPCFHEEQLLFLRWMSQYYCFPLSQVIETAIPQPTPPKTTQHWSVPSGFATNAEKEPFRGRKQKEIFSFISSYGTEGVSHTLLTKNFPGSSGVLKRLIALGALHCEEHEEDICNSLLSPLSPTSEGEIHLNEKQHLAVQEIHSSLASKTFSPFLLHGVTGSGKTEVYIEAAQKALAQGGSVLILVPEIALTPQLVDRFRTRLSYPIAIIHSGLPKRTRWESWQALLQGKCRVALGARSALFAPIRDLSLLIVDEEHDTSYKQGDGLRYNARDLALVRGSLEKATVLLGSATPSVETFYNASIKKLRYLRLKDRPFSSEKLQYEIVNLNKVPHSDMPSSSISPALYDAIQETLIRGEQVFLLYNRRGFARYLQCEACEAVVYCPNCSVPLTYHQRGNKLLCHHCSFSAVPAKYCAVCTESGGSSDTEEEKEPLLVLRGSGTQKILEELQELFPEARSARLDRDSADKLANLEEILAGVRNREIQILAGTQMIAKGHDLPGVTLVGIVDCDVGLHMPDFRSAERVFQLLTQAGGRAGRRELPGRVLLQTRVPNHSSITLTTEENFHEFAKRELTLRKKLHYPPFTKLVRVIASAPEQELPLEYLRSLLNLIDEWKTKHNLPIDCIGPSRAPLEKVKALFRAHLMLRAERSTDLRRLVTALRERVRPPRKLRLVYDIDPQDML
ncbi:primosomal protein N' [bacterium]|nr:primosomal protein N' [bacterium]